MSSHARFVSHLSDYSLTNPSQIVLGSIAQKPQMAISRSALSHLDSAYNLFLSVSDKKRTAKILVIRPTFGCILPTYRLAANPTKAARASSFEHGNSGVARDKRSKVVSLRTGHQE